MYKSLAIVGIRLIGIWMIFTGLVPGIMTIVNMLTGGFDSLGDENLFSSSYLILYLTLGVLALNFSTRLGGWLARDLTAQTDGLGNANGIAIGTFLIGLYFFFGYFPTALTQTAFLFRADQAFSIQKAGEGFVSDWLAVVFAVLVMAKSGWVGEVFSRIRKK